MSNLNNKMDSSSFDPETSLSSLARKCLNLEEDTEKNKSLSNLTAKYNTTRNNMNVFTCTDDSRNPTFTDRSQLNLGNKTFRGGVSNSTTEKRRCLSPSDDESDSGFPGLSLAALASKHKLKVSSGSSQSKSSEQDKLDDSSEDEYSDTGFIGSLVALAAKHKGIQNTNSDINVSSGLSVVQNDESKIPNIKSAKLNLPAPNEVSDAKSSAVTFCQEGLSNTVSERSEKNALELKPRFISASFSDDSDSDESFTLGGLALKHARTASQSESGATDDDKIVFKPKELQRVSNYHRHYSKSESDQFAVTQTHTGNTTNEVIRNESSASLGSLKGSDSSKQDFEFLLGCNIPHSFKCRQIGLTASLSSVQVPQANLNSSYSDPDVSVKEKKHDKSSFHGLWNDSNVSPSKDIGGIGGINLACAIKSLSSTNVSQDIDTDVQVEPMDEEIVTLLDSMNVDEDVEVNKSKKSASVAIWDKKDDCCLDARYILKVKTKLRTMKCSSLGKVVCKQWRPLEMPYVRREEIKSCVLPFKFTSPSPDDVMAGFRDRRLQSSSLEQHNSENK